jgi:hypothetical protein
LMSYSFYRDLLLQALYSGLSISVSLPWLGLKTVNSMHHNHRNILSSTSHMTHCIFNKQFRWHYMVDIFHSFMFGWWYLTVNFENIVTLMFWGVSRNIVLVIDLYDFSNMEQISVRLFQL